MTRSRVQCSGESIPSGHATEKNVHLIRGAVRLHDMRHKFPTAPRMKPHRDPAHAVPTISFRDHSKLLLGPVPANRQFLRSLTVCPDGVSLEV